MSASDPLLRQHIGGSGQPARLTNGGAGSREPERLREPLPYFHCPPAGFVSLIDDSLPIWASIASVAAQLGHSSPKTTLDRYAHATPQDQRDAVAIVGRALTVV